MLVYPLAHMIYYERTKWMQYCLVVQKIDAAQRYYSLATRANAHDLRCDAGNDVCAQTTHTPGC